MYELGVDAGGEFGVTRGKIAVISKTKAKAMDLSCLPCDAFTVSDELIRDADIDTILLSPKEWFEWDIHVILPEPHYKAELFNPYRNIRRKKEGLST